MENNKENKAIKTLAAWVENISGVGNILARGLPSVGGLNGVPDQQQAMLMNQQNPDVPKYLIDRTTGWSQLGNVSQHFDMEKVQAACRAAEVGNPRLLFTYYRDFFYGSGIVGAELGKRKLATTSEEYYIMPASDSPEDIKAAEVIEQLLNRTKYFKETLNHMMNAVIYPVSVTEKTFKPIDKDYGSNEFNLKYQINKLKPVSYDLLNYQLPYLPQNSGNSLGANVINPQSLGLVAYNQVGSPDDVIYDVDSDEPDLRLWYLLPSGIPVQSPTQLIRLKQDEFIIYRNNILQGIARDNFGGLGKSLLFLTIMSQLGLQVFLQCLQKFGKPFVLAKVNAEQVDTVNKLMQTFTDTTIINALVVNKDADVQIEEMSYANAAEAHVKFIELIHGLISLLLCGQELSSHAKSTGLGSGVANLQGQVREDIIKSDRNSINECLKHSLFKQLLDINNIPGNVPDIIFGSSDTVENNLKLSTIIYNLNQAGIQVEEDSYADLSTKLGFKISKNLEPTQSKQFNKPNDKQEELEDANSTN